MTRARRHGLTARDSLYIVAPALIGIFWGIIAVDLTFLLEIDWLAAPHGAIAVITYVIQLILFWPSALFLLVTRAMPVVGWQPGWLGLTLVAIACGGVPGAFVGLAALSWSRR